MCFFIFVGRNQKLTSELDEAHHFGYKTRVFRLGSAYFEK